MKRSPTSLWVEAALASKNMAQAEVARELSARLPLTYDRSQIHKMVQGKRALSADEMLAIEEITGFPAPSNFTVKMVPLIDMVTAGKLAAPKSQIPVEDVPLLAYADLGPGDFFALKVVGTSMDRVSPEGSIIVINRADRTLISGKYYVFAVRGESTYKVWQAGPPAYLAPASYDAFHKPYFPKRKGDLEVVGRVKTTTLEL